MNVTGLLTRNTFQNVVRALNFVDKKPVSTVHMLNWADYINPTSLDNFEKETNIRIVHEVFTNSTETKDLLHQGSDKYDVMVQAGAQMRQVLDEEERGRNSSTGRKFPTRSFSIRRRSATPMFLIPTIPIRCLTCGARWGWA